MPDETEGRPPLQERLASFAKRHWDWAVVAVLAVWMFVVRLRPFGTLRTDDGTFFIGTDPYYHARQVFFSVGNFPSTLGYDPMTQYPIGTDPGQFGTLFDVLGAGLAWVVGLFVDGGHPSPETTLAVFHAYPALLGALTLVPIFLLARDLVGRWAALFTTVVAALLSGEFLVRSLAGYVDHHVLEVLLSTLAVWATLRALRAWEHSGLTLEILLEDPRQLWDPAAGRRALFVSLGAAVAFWAYLAAWPSGVLFVGIVGAWIVLDTLFEHARDQDPSPVVLTGVAVFVPVALLMTLHDHRPGFSALNYTWMQPTAALLVALAAAALGALSVVWRRRRVPAVTFPFAGAGLAVASVVVLRTAVPQLWLHIENGFGWITGIGVRRTRLTIAEAKPLTDQDGGWANALHGEFGLLWIVAAIGLVLVLVSAARGMRRADTLLVVWGALMTLAVFTQVRFLYYLAVVVALLTGEVFAKLAHGYRLLTRSMDPGAGKRARAKRHPASKAAPDTGGSAVQARVFAALLLTLVLLPVNVLGTDSCADANAWTLAGCFSPGEEALWHDPLVWMREETPPIPLSLTTQYEEPPRGQRFDYPEGTYGVLSWWDYGHQIEFEAQRPPVANPFQQQAPLASLVFTERSEDVALSRLDDYLGPDNEVRYVVIDDAMVTTKYPAITIWAERFDAYWTPARLPFVLPEGGQSLRLPVYGYSALPTFLQRMYFDDGMGLEHFRLVHESAVYSVLGHRGRINEDGFTLLTPNTILTRLEADDMVEQFGSLNFEAGDQMLPAGGPRIAYDVRVESSVKVYERVAGAVLVGTAEPGADVSASVPLVVGSSGRQFVYRVSTTAGPDGRFELPVAYSTGDPVPLSQGGTQVDVVARAPYRVSAGDAEAQVDVPDLAVLDGLQVPVGFG